MPITGTGHGKDPGVWHLQMQLQALRVYPCSEFIIYTTPLQELCSLCNAQVSKHAGFRPWAPQIKPAWKFPPKFKQFFWVLAHFCPAEFQQAQETRLPNIRGELWRLHTCKHLSDSTTSSIPKRVPSMRLKFNLQEHTLPSSLPSLPHNLT